MVRVTKSHACTCFWSTARDGLFTDCMTTSMPGQNFEVSVKHSLDRMMSCQDQSRTGAASSAGDTLSELQQNRGACCIITAAKKKTQRTSKGRPNIRWASFDTLQKTRVISALDTARWQVYLQPFLSIHVVQSVKRLSSAVDKKQLLAWL